MSDETTGLIPKLTDSDIAKMLTDCGLEFDGVYVERPGLYATDLRPSVRVELHEGSSCTYDILVMVSARLGTTDIRFGYEREHEYSEVTFDSSKAWLEIRLPAEVTT